MKFNDILMLEGNGKMVFDPMVRKLQLFLKKTGKYNLGKSGKNYDGVDGLYGKLTDKACRKEFGKPFKTNNSKDKKINVNKPTSDNKAVLVGGLNYRPGDKSTSEQTSILSNAIGQPVKGFDYDESDDNILRYLKSNPGIPVFLFSAGCKKAEVLSNSSYVNKNQLYIIEPFASGTTKAIINKAVNNGVPARNVYVGKNSSRGYGVVNGTSDSNAKRHWDAISSVGDMVTHG
jgi:hypothetical protein